MVMKFHKFDIFYKICYIFDPSSALACRVKSTTYWSHNMEKRFATLHVLPSILMVLLVAYISCSFGGKIPLHVRSLIAYDSYDTALKFADIQHNATAHVNALEGLLDDYELCFDWDWTLVSIFDWLIVFIYQLFSTYSFRLRTQILHPYQSTHNYKLWWLPLVERKHIRLKTVTLNITKYFFTWQELCIQQV